MSVIVTDTGFSADDWVGHFSPIGTANADAFDLGADTGSDRLDQVLKARIVRIDFPSFSDGRGFTLARMLRLKGYTGRLRARGHVLADQYAMARRVGFDEVEISEDLAERQPEASWVFRADWQENDYQSRLRAKAG